MKNKHLSYKDQNHETTQDEGFKNTLFFGLFDDPETKRIRSGSMKRQYSDMGDSYHRVYEEKGEEEERIDMKVLMLLEYFRELYVREIQILKKIFPGVKDEFLDFFKKIEQAMSRFKKPCDRSKPPTMQRSLSVGCVASRDFDQMKNERFKVTTVSTGSSSGGGTGSSAATGQGQTKK